MSWIILYTTCRCAWKNTVAVQNLKGEIIHLILSRKGGGHVPCKRNSYWIFMKLYTVVVHNPQMCMRGWFLYTPKLCFREYEKYRSRYEVDLAVSVISLSSSSRRWMQSKWSINLELFSERIPSIQRKKGLCYRSYKSKSAKGQTTVYKTYT
jgi:hypothetical protein